MKLRSSRRSSVVQTVTVGFAAVFVACASLARGADADLAGKLPAGGNAVMTVDVDRLVDSPWGKQNGLKEKLATGYAGRPIPVPANAKQVAVSAKLNPVGLYSSWQAALIELPAAPRLEAMLKAQGGYLDDVGGKKAAWTPRDVFYVALDGNTLGVVRPGSRQQVAAWAGGKSAGAASASPYLAKAMAAAGSGDAAPVAVFALDLRDAVGPAAVGYALSMGELPALDDVEAGLSELVAALGSVQGTTVTVTATNALNAEWAIDFDKDVSKLGAKANALVIDVLKSADAYDADAEKWNFKAEGKRIVGKRQIDEEAFTRLVGILAPAHAGGAADANGDAQPAAAKTDGGAAAAAANPAEPNAKASQAYYLAVAKKIDALGPNPSMTSGASAMRSMSTQIQQLPVLGVDPALITWGASVCEALTRAGQELAIGQQRAQAASASVSSPSATYNYEGGSTPESRAAFRNAQLQRRTVAQSERAAAADKALSILNQVAPGRAKVRAEMTQKFGVEF